MPEILRPGIKEACEVFWRHIQSRTPPVIKEHDVMFVNEALLIALGKLNMERDREFREWPVLQKRGD